MRNRRLMLLMAVALVFLLAGSAFAKVKLTFWNGFTGPDRPVVEALVAQFNEENPDIEIEMDIMPWDTFMQKLLPSYIVGQGPDIAGLGAELLPRLVDAGVLAPIDDVFTETNLTREMLAPFAVDAATYKGHLYGTPMSNFALLMYYNIDHFTAAGLAPEAPTNWDEWLEAAIKLSNPPQQYGFVMPTKQAPAVWHLLMWSNGGGILGDNGEVLIDSAESKEAVKFWADAVLKHEISPIGLTGPETDKVFQTGKASMHIVGPWMTTGFTEAGLNYDVAPIPEGPVTRATVGGVTSMAISKQAGEDPVKRQAVYRFLEFWNSEEAQIKWALGANFPPNRIDIADNPEILAHPWVPKFTAGLAYARGHLVGTPHASEIESDIYDTAIEYILLGRKSVDDALNEAGQKLRDLLK
jgi:multiple sugar transport system substrate-binding protein